MSSLEYMIDQQKVPRTNIILETVLKNLNKLESSINKITGTQDMLETNNGHTSIK